MADDKNNVPGWRPPPERPPTPAFERAVQMPGIDKVEQAQRSQPREKDGPKVSAMRARLRQLEGQLGHGAPKQELKPGGTTKARDLQGVEKERRALDKQIAQIDRVREQFNERNREGRSR